jgi:hypothetical protein
MFKILKNKFVFTLREGYTEDKPKHNICNNLVLDGNVSALRNFRSFLLFY